MNFLNGYKTIIGAAFLAVSQFIGSVGPEYLTPEAYMMLNGIVLGIGTFLTAIGIGHKLDKTKQ